MITEEGITRCLRLKIPLGPCYILVKYVTKNTLGMIEMPEVKTLKEAKLSAKEYLKIQGRLTTTNFLKAKGHSITFRNEKVFPAPRPRSTAKIRKVLKRRS